jgi:hypothetical protein
MLCQCLIALLVSEKRELNLVSNIMNRGPQEVAQSAGTPPNKAEVTSSNPPSPSCADMSKKRKYNE